MFGLKIDCENGHELFKGEVLQILMAMKGQLKLRELEKHVVFPVSRQLPTIKTRLTTLYFSSAPGLLFHG